MDNTFSLTQLLNEIVSDIDESNKKKGRKEGKKCKESADTDLEKMAEKKMKETTVEEAVDGEFPQGTNVSPNDHGGPMTDAFRAGVEAASSGLKNLGSKIAPPSFSDYPGRVQGDYNGATEAGDAVADVNPWKVRSSGESNRQVDKAIENAILDKHQANVEDVRQNNLMNLQAQANQREFEKNHSLASSDKVEAARQELAKAQQSGVNPWMIGVPAALAAGAGALALRKKLRDAKKA